MKELEKGKNIVLTGNFSIELLYELEEIVSKQEITLPTGENIKFAGKLVLDINKVNGDPVLKDSCVFNRFANNPYVSVTPKNLNDGTEDYVEDCPEDFDENIKADDFILTRKRYLQQQIESNKLFKLMGPSGVGKSSIIKELQKDTNNNIDITIGLENLDSWASDPEDAADKNKLKVLFIDEANIKDMHFTMFSPMLNSDEATILYQGKLYNLTNKHKVVFASNPEEYGGGRFKPDLFDYIPGTTYKDFPKNYIYEQILKPIINMAYKNDDAKDKQTIISQCHETLIPNYLRKNQEKRDSITVRELQQQLLEEITEIKTPKLFSGIQSSNADFYAFASQAQALNKIETFIRIQKNKASMQQDISLGINGLYIEGEPGVGKSKIIEFMLKNEGYIKDENYIKIEASLAYENKKELIQQAFHEGQTIWIDELNTCIDDGLEEVLNAVLTGTDLSGQPAQKNGFMLLATGNSIALSGRSKLSPAMLHRLDTVDLKGPSKDDPAELYDYINYLHTKEGNQIIDREKMREIKSTLFKQYKNGEINLRDISNKWPQLVGMYTSSSSITLGQKDKYMSEKLGMPVKSLGLYFTT